MHFDLLAPGAGIAGAGFTGCGETGNVFAENFCWFVFSVQGGGAAKLSPF